MKKIFLLLVFLFISISITSQNSNEASKKLPNSIYTLNSFNNSNDFYAINKKLNLTDFSFVYVNQTDLDLNLFSFDTKNLSKKPSEFIYDDYKRYQDNNLLKGFLLKNDPTRWHPINFRNCN